ncbi:hypothetical protein BUPH_04599 (plasmid) [Paraburkholderia phenoliruptrix BR3459a]|uniref:Uncharacterized protein n=1 Tax=Paraburkholderia phenoliruptrix BR3459a TaxID=1229205 RepID=K0DYS0_9BURK|nr:hypothetical protein BUPH_04599 [Paraburkholderia phenoliruptrix BR3459a]
MRAAALADKKDSHTWRTRIDRWASRWWETLDERVDQPASNGVNPQRAFTELSPRLRDIVTVTSDAGSANHFRH